ncbi:MAG: Cof-type HAD-IIB family hydrolase [Mycoplasmataceae bacterium]|nr:Cof-type HAD-IIB family hydrolase [Mycoplasmataceae bacterium]
MFLYILQVKKIIFCDIDDTLAKRMRKISKKNIEAIKEYTKRGGKFIMATGRSIVSAYRFQEQINEAIGKEEEFLICSTGGYIVDKKNKIIIKHLIPNDVAWRIFELAKRNDLWCLFYTEEANDKRGVYAKSIWFWWILKMFKNLNVLKIRDNTNLTSFKIIISSFIPSKVRSFVDILNEKFANQVSFTLTNKLVIEINAFGINKASAASEIMKHEGVCKEDVAAIGDSGNDINLFDIVSLPIAIKTKNELVKQHSMYHVKSFKNGVAIAINDYILNE